jgi:hypothetical protein
MSNRRKPRSPRTSLIDESAASDHPPVARIGGPADALAMIPYLFGFEPHESVVVVSLKGPRRRFGPIVRGDLVEPSQAEVLVEYLANVVDSHGFEAVLIAAYSTRESAAAQVVPGLAEALASSGVTVYEALRTDGSRWWSYTCDRGCCPPEGTPYDPATTAVAALAVSMGMGKLPSREALAQQFAPRFGEVRETANDVAWALACATAVDEGSDLERMSTLIESSLGIDRIGGAALGMLLGGVQDLLARDVAWLLMTRDNADRHFELWRQVTTVADDELLPPAGALCAFAAWLAGRGALAAMAVERVAEVAPDYPFLELIAHAIQSGMNPDVWGEYREMLSADSADRPMGGA